MLIQLFVQVQWSSVCGVIGPVCGVIAKLKPFKWGFPSSLLFQPGISCSHSLYDFLTFSYVHAHDQRALNHNHNYGIHRCLGST